MSPQDDDRTLILGYSSTRNITFAGTIECHGVTVGEWKSWHPKDRDEFLTEQVFELVDVWAEVED